ncbi:hypothetical protein [Sandaracinus amylolyticus]|uniref:hypothetical protein n=1 Tax=Sandaracinus amylolyticus TaxID=927083 RepID=UPI00069F7636|nr:hypothetical protein [Sandaracinus amylolyticus]
MGAEVDVHLKLVMVAGAVVCFVGCSGDDDLASDDASVGSDAGWADAGALGDAASEVDSAVQSDGGPTDGSAGACSECGEMQACVRSVCVDTCGADLSAWEGALGAGLVPVANFCRSADAYGVIGAAGRAPVVYDLLASTDDDDFVYAVSRWTAQTGMDIAPSEVATVRVEVDPAWGAARPFPNGFVAINADETALLFGYTVFVSPESVPGEIFRVTIGSGETTAFTAPGNFDAAWIDDADFVVSGLGLGTVADGHGLYAYDASEDETAHVATNLGVYSGAVGLTADYAIAGGSAADFSSQVFSVSRSAFDGAFASGTPIDMMLTGSRVAAGGMTIPSAFSISADGRQLTAAEYMGPIRVWSVSQDSGSLTLSPQPNLASGTFTTAFAAGDGRVMLRHSDGLLLVAER